MTERQTEVLNLIKQGKTNKEIESSLFISIHTVKTHIGEILKELEASNRAHAVFLALKRGLIGFY